LQKITSFGLLLADGGDIRSGKGAAYCPANGGMKIENPKRALKTVSVAIN